MLSENVKKPENQWDAEKTENADKTGFKISVVLI